MEEKEKRTERINIRILPSAKQIAEKNANEDGRSLSSYIERLILKEQEKKVKR